MIDLGMVVAAVLALWGLFVAPFETIAVAVLVLAVRHMVSRNRDA